MKTIGFYGGNLLSKVGSVNDVSAFFYCIDEFIEKKKKLKIITNRLYKHYILLEELDVAISVMNEIQSVFKEINPGSIDWDSLLLKESSLNVDAKNLAVVFDIFFTKFANTVEASKDFYNEWGIYQAVRTVVADVPDYMKYKKLPLEQYDAVVGDPLWLR